MYSVKYLCRYNGETILFFHDEIERDIHADMQRESGMFLECGYIAGLDEIPLPAHWASAIFNGDTSGMADSEIAQMNATLASRGNPNFTGINGEGYFSDVGRNVIGADWIGGDTLNYLYFIPE